MSHHPAEHRRLSSAPSINTNGQNVVEQHPLPSFVLTSLPGRNFTNDPSLAPAPAPEQVGSEAFNNYNTSIDPSATLHLPTQEFLGIPAPSNTLQPTLVWERSKSRRRVPTPAQQSRPFKCSQPECAWTFKTKYERRHHEELIHGITVNQEDLAWQAQKEAARAARTKDRRRKAEAREARRAEKAAAAIQESKDKKEDKLKRVTAAKERVAAQGRIICRLGLCVKKFKSEKGRELHEREFCKYRQIGN